MVQQNAFWTLEMSLFLRTTSPYLLKRRVIDALCRPRDESRRPDKSRAF